MKDLHIKLDNGDNMNLEALQKKYKCSKTDLISSLLEIAYNCTVNIEYQKYCEENNPDGWITNDELDAYLSNCIYNRK